MCGGGHCECSADTGCILARADACERRALRMSFSPRQPLGETAKVLGIGD